MPKVIYLDYNATTPLDPRVFEAMQPYFTASFGNPASQIHTKGWEAKHAVDLAREQVAQLLQCQPAEIAFTSGATESNNWAIKGLVDQLLEQDPSSKIHVLTSNIEHASVREPLLFLQKKGLIEVDFLPVSKEGFITIEDLQKARKPHTRLVSLIWVHNELGTIQNMKDIAQWCKDKNLYLHTDATQAVGKMDVNLSELPISLLSFSGHKIYGPKGIGALFIRQQSPKVLLKPLLHGGGQEKLGRSGTSNVPAIVGLGKACALAQAEMKQDWDRLSEMTWGFWKKLSGEFPSLVLNGPLKYRSVYSLNVTFPGLAPADLLPKIQTLCVSGGSACSSDNFQGNPVLVAIGYAPTDNSVTLRISLGRNTTQLDLDQAFEVFSKSLKSLNFVGVHSQASL